MSFTFPTNYQVHIWQASLSVSEIELASLYEYLSVDEQQRANRFVLPEHRMHFIVARAGLRQVLGAYLSIVPQHIQFEYSAHGKPCLCPTQQSRPPLYFNLAHSHDQVVYALSHLSELGIDLELLRTDCACLPIAQHYFSAREYAALSQLSSPLLEQAFFYCWTRKEALLKALGHGLLLPLDQFDVGVFAQDLSLTLPANWSHQKWVLHNVILAPGWIASLAIQAQEVTLCHYSLASSLAPRLATTTTFPLPVGGKNTQFC